MFVQINHSRLQLIQGDIARQRADAIVNAANARLAGGGGVDGALHRAAGPSLLEATRTHFPDGCPTGSAVATEAGNLAARFVFHAVGPRWRGGHRGEPDQLRSAYQRCLELTIEQECDSIVFPAIGTGAYGYPIDLAARIALQTVSEFLIEHGRPATVTFSLFDAGTYAAFARLLERMVNERPEEKE